MNYNQFLKSKAQLTGMYGFNPGELPSYLFDFQKYLIDWALKKGKSAIFADCGLGKSIMALNWAQKIIEKTNKNVLIVTPLSVAAQFVREGEKFGIECKRSKDGKVKSKITITNYEKLHLFDRNDFIGVVCDESSILKNFKGATKRTITKFMAKMPYRVLFSATPSPNDFTELGTSSESLGYMGYLEMISRFFRDTQNDKNPAWSTPKYVLKKHAVSDFWEWVSSWARGVKMPSDLGFKNNDFKLPELIEKEHILECSKPLPGELFVKIARTLKEQREERKITLDQRVKKVHDLVMQNDCSVIWGNYNYETDLLEKIIPNSVQVSGSDKNEAKEEKFEAFRSGEVKRIIIKPKIGAWGLNWQFCNHMTFFPTHSYEQYYQGVRRCWRFGQKKAVYVDIITTSSELGVLKNVQRKAEEASIMFEKLILNMNSNYKNKVEEIEKELINLPNWI